MTRLAIVTKPKDGYAITTGFDIKTTPPALLFQRVESAMTWLMRQAQPHEVILDDPTGVCVALVCAWLFTNHYQCDVRFISADGSQLVHLGLGEDGFPFANAWGPL